MANKVSYAKLNLKVNNDINTFIFNDTEIEVKKYLPIKDKYDMLTDVLRKAEENNIYNDLLLDIYFHLELVYMYTNISFTDKQREDEFKLYDSLASNGFFDKFLMALDEVEYNDLLVKLNTIKQDIMKYGTTVGYVLKTLINDLPAKAAEAASIVDTFDKTKYKEVLNYAEALNGNRPLPKEVKKIN